MDSSTIPVLFIIFNRPDVTRQVFEAIRKQKPKYLYVAADGPRENKPGEKEKCELTRKVVTEGIDWDCEIKLLFRERNMGCGAGPANAISWFFEQVEEGIILEDDCLPNESFFSYCAAMLEQYRTESQVMMICGTSYQPQPLNADTYYFSKYVHVWGWATWRRAWQPYTFELTGFSREQDVAILNRTFSNTREKRSWLHCFKLIRNGLDAWDYQWMHCIWRNNGVTIIPWKNLIANLGFGIDATHTFDSNSAQAGMQQFELNAIHHPKQIALHQKANKLERYSIIISPLLKHLLNRADAKLSRVKKKILR